MINKQNRVKVQLAFIFTHTEKKEQLFFQTQWNI